MIFRQRVCGNLGAAILLSPVIRALREPRSPLALALEEWWNQHDRGRQVGTLNPGDGVSHLYQS